MLTVDVFSLQNICARVFHLWRYLINDNLIIKLILKMLSNDPQSSKARKFVESALAKIKIVATNNSVKEALGKIERFDESFKCILCLSLVLNP